MTQRMRKGLVRLRAGFRRIPPLHALLFAAYPPLALFGLNIDQLWPGAVVRPLAESVGAALVGWMILSALFRSLTKGAALATLSVFVYFGYGYGVDMVHAVGGEKAAEWSRFGGLVPLGIVFAGAVSVLRRHAPPHSLTAFLNTAAALLVAFPLIGATTYYAGRRRLPLTDASRGPVLPTAGGTPSRDLRPDIYFIVLDAYAREDVLRNLFRFDNQPFLTALRARGFQVADEALSNYTVTFLSLAATLNMRYLDDLIQEASAAGVDRDMPGQLIHDNAVQRFLKAQGYRVIHFPSGWAVTDHSPHADVVMGRRSLQEFRSILNRPTLPGTLFPARIQRGWREMIFSTLDSLGRMGAEPGPKFVFAHIVCPHEPFVFYPDGGNPLPDFIKESYRTRWTKRRRYLDNLEFISRRILGVIDRILADSPTPPIIILQSDHGPASLMYSPKPPRHMVHERVPILCAVRVPDGKGPSLPSNLTSVNTFRFVFDAALGTSLGLLENRSYYCDPAVPYQPVDVSGCCDKAENPFADIPFEETARQTTKRADDKLGFRD